jgi:hypothetical protein
MQILATANDAETRQRLAAPAVRAFAGLAKAWGLRTDEQLQLLGYSLSRQTWANWQSSPPPELSVDQLARISYLLGIYEGLQRIWRRAPEEGDAWIRRPRAEAPFDGEAPLVFMRSGGIPALVQVRAYVDAATGGPPSREWYPPPPREA